MSPLNTKNKLLWRSIAACWLFNSIAAAAFSVLDPMPCALLSMAVLLLMQLILYRRAMLVGFDASQMRDLIDRLAETAPDRISELDPRRVRSAYRPSAGFHNAALCAAVPAAVNALWMLLVLLGCAKNAAFDALQMLVRLNTLPFYAPLAPWLGFTGEAGGLHALMLLVLPLVYPVAAWFGYRNGHQKWCNSNRKMQESTAKGPRKIVKKVKKYKISSQTPEI